MKYLMNIMTSATSNTHLYPFVKDPFNNGRVCINARFLGSYDLLHLMQDSRFQFISDQVIYFKGIETLDIEELECYNKQLAENQII